jgi:hypothetical protein
LCFSFFANYNKNDEVWKITWVGDVESMGRRGMDIGFWCENQKEREH